MNSPETAGRWVIYSPNESALHDGAGYWSNSLGWVELDLATHFSTELACSMPLPQATGHDARFVTLREADRHRIQAALLMNPQSSRAGYPSKWHQ